MNTTYPYLSEAEADLFCFSEHITSLYLLICLLSSPSLWVSNSDMTQLKKELDDLVDAIIENFFEPKKNKLQPKPE